jgi:pSer/pThr/pTyr-binding forkhead associated (FHA) protein
MTSRPPGRVTPEDVRERVLAERRALPFLLYRDGVGAQAVLELELERERLTIGRRPTSDVALSWDGQVSRVHAELARIGGDWIVCDDGISHNGTFVNGDRVRGRRRLRGGDVISVGETLIAFCAPASGSTVATTAARRPGSAVSVTPAQRRVLVALCRPLAGPGYAAPASNRQIADELVISVETVKGTLNALFERFGLEQLPQNQKRAALAASALGLLARD